MPDYLPSLVEEEDEIPWDCDGWDDDLGNYGDEDEDD